MKKIYLACPYSHPDPAVMEARFKEINQVAGDLMRQGCLVFSPISHTHPIAVCCELPRGFEFWEQHNRTFIDWCDELWVKRLDGWKESKGVTAEIQYADRMGKKIMYI